MNPVHRREFATFISYAHVDKAIVDKLYDWLHNVAGISVWYDDDQLPSGELISNYLPEAVARCRSMIVVLSKDSVRSDWVKKEHAVADGQGRGFRIIPLRIDECEPPSFLPFRKWIPLTGGALDLSICNQILDSMYHDEQDSSLGRTRDVYVSRTWRESEARRADDVCGQFITRGFRLIGDAKDHKHFGERRVEAIISSCGAFLAILPARPPADLRFFREEIEIARSLGLPSVILAEQGTEIDPAWEDQEVGPSLCVPLSGDGADLLGAVEFLKERWDEPRNPHYTFLSTDFDDAHAVRNRTVRSVVQRVTAVPCQLGAEIRGDQIYRRISDSISKAMMVIADISGSNGSNLNTCIEAGIARGAGRPLHLVSAGPRTQPPFMLRDYEVGYYKDDVELLGLAHKIAYEYRRRVLNWELR